MTTQKRAVLYARVSSDDSGKDGRNLDGQIDMGREYATKRGYSIVAELSEDNKGASGAEIDLPQLNRIRDMARASEFDVLIVREIDRLSRNLAKQLIVESELKRAGVRIEYVIGEYADTPKGNFMKHVRASVAEFEREKIRERMVRGRRLTVKNGNILLHGRVPFGYMLNNNSGKAKLEVYEPEARIVRMIYSWYINGDDATGEAHSLASIARRLNDMGVPSLEESADRKLQERRKAKGLTEGRGAHKRPINKRWRLDAIAHFLHSETHVGVWRYGKKTYDQQNRTVIVHPKSDLLALEVPPVVSRDDWDAAQARLDDNRTSKRGEPIHHYLLSSGRAICGCCERKMSGTTSRHGKYQYYRCPRRSYGNSASKHNISCPMTQTFHVDHVDSAIWEWIKSFLKDPKSLNQKLNLSRQERDKKNKPLYERLKVADDLLAENQAQLDRVLDLYQAGKSKETKEAVSDRIERLRETVNKLKRERAELNAKLEAQTITAEQIREIESFADVMREEIDLADQDFKARRYMIIRLNTTATLTIEDGAKVAHASCLIGKKRLSLSSDSI